MKNIDQKILEQRAAKRKSYAEIAKAGESWQKSYQNRSYIENKSVDDGLDLITTVLIAEAVFDILDDN